MVSLVTVIPASFEDREVVDRMLQACLKELQVFEGGSSSQDRIPYPYLDLYWVEAERHPFLFVVDDAVAGFAFVRTGPVNEMAEFYVDPNSRHKHVGTSAAREVFGRFPGAWSVHELPDNSPAVSFWRRAIPYAFDEQTDSEGTTQTFTVD